MFGRFNDASIATNCVQYHFTCLSSLNQFVTIWT